jgi:polar amino acid transport system substrate-binding protein
VTRRAVLFTAFLALGIPLAAQQGKLLAPTGTLRASFIATNPVQGRVDAKTGATTGPAADLTRELARRLGVPAVVMPLSDAGAVLDSVKSANT